jgi:hypothetical protein
VVGRKLVAALAASAAIVAAAAAGSALSSPHVVNLTPVLGTEDYAVGPVRVSFLLLGPQGAPRYRSDVRVRVWSGKSPSGRALADVPASLEQIGVPGVKSGLGDITRLYVAHFRAPHAGTYSLVASAAGSKPVRASWKIDVSRHPKAPAVGSKAIASDTPTIASTHGNLRELTTRTPPDKALLRYSIAASLQAHKPFVVVFATPKFCTSRTCGPVVDVVDAVRKEVGPAKTGIRYIHVEVYKNNDPGLGYNQWFKQWHLPTEPWIFLVGKDGKIKARFEGSVSVRELAASVRQYLA